MSSTQLHNEFFTHTGYNSESNDFNNTSASIFDSEIYRKIEIGEIDCVFKEPNKLLLCKVVAEGINVEETTRTVIIDNADRTCNLVVNGMYDIQEGYFIGILNPRLSTNNSETVIECSEYGIFMFETLQDFKSAGWVEKSLTKEDTEELVTLGKKLLNNKNYEEALVQFILANNKVSQSAQILSYISTCHLHLGNYSEAYSHAKLAYDYNNQYRRAGILCVKTLIHMSKLNEAYLCYEDVIQKHPENIELLSLKKKLDSKVQNIRPYTRKLQKVNQTRLSRLKELVLIEWPRLISSDKIKQKLESEGVPVDRLTIRGKTAILFYTNVETREFAREKLLSMPDSEFMLANEPAPFI